MNPGGRPQGEAEGAPAAPLTQDAGRLRGLGVGGATAAGPVARMAARPPEPSATARPGADPAQEAARAEAALRAVARELSRRAGVARDELDRPEAADILDAQALMAEDPSLLAGIGERTAAGLTAERAVFETFGHYRDMLAASGGYLADRVGDLDDLAARAVAAATGVPMPGVPDPPEPFVLVALDLAPADTALLDLAKVLALVTQEGGPTSHTAILARARGIPAVVGVAGALDLADGTPVLVDAAAGTVTANPTPRLLAAAAERNRARERAATATGPGRTADGVPISLLANIGGPGDVAAAVAAGAEGVGLFRTEFLYLGCTTPPTLETQVDAYRAVLDGFPGRRVVARTLDAGADKPLPFLPLGSEPNPALGVRGLRAFRGEYRELLDTQLAALAKAAEGAAAELWVMAPMIADENDAAWFAEQARAHGLRMVGAMIEVPSAALRAGPLLSQVDFVSLGTNDLTQYTLAADRMMGSLGALQSPWHPAVLRLIELTGTAGRSCGKPVGVCGEAAADPRLAPVLVGLGVTSLSMAPSAIPEVRAALAEHTLRQCRELARAALR
ncbi:phosphoenolpyruvate--protein phosphotransferase [Actinocrinis puniceicyclus]|uniref:Phosphoenolpyruvate-protein phosphotransferase n=1 Tax=Actinocrinis puniceicyclus TaxID=977794 RepID=A0A8J7WLX8_9ACTN|nr:phosphoenolpyruvate--protein phosphotransferase [Actinocrinis puniceicyclus]MBS2962547.1 phosphoenolpyruvate--protein phosphotransferase [Actinocrinis puniceicyclus]